MIVEGELSRSQILFSSALEQQTGRWRLQFVVNVILRVRFFKEIQDWI